MKALSTIAVFLQIAPTMRFVLIVGAIFALVAVSIVVARTHYVGIGWNNDAPHKLTIANNIANGRGYVNNFGSPGNAIIPPGYPISIALVSSATGADVEKSAIVVNCISLALLVIVAGLVLGKFASSRRTVILGLLLLVTTPTLLQWSFTVMSDLIFLPFFAVFVYLFVCWFRSPKQALRYASLIGASIGLAFIARYVGATLMPIAGVLVVLLVVANWKELSTREWIAATLVLVCSALLLPILWVFRNIVALGYPFEHLNRQVFPNPVDTLAKELYMVANWFPFLKYDHSIVIGGWSAFRLGVEDVIALGLLALVVAAPLLLIPFVRRGVVACSRKLAQRYSVATVVIATAIGYVVFTAFLLHSGGELYVRQRFVLPVFVLISIFLVPVFDLLLAYAKSYAPAVRRTATVVTAVALIVVFVSSAISSSIHFIGQRPIMAQGSQVESIVPGLGLNDPAWHNLDTAVYLKANRCGDIILSNAPSMAFAMSGRIDAHILSLRQIERIDRIHLSGPYCIAFIPDPWQFHLDYDLDDLIDLAERGIIDELITDQHGAIFGVLPNAHP